MAIKVRFNFITRYDKDVLDAIEFTVHASLNVGRQVDKGIEPIKNRWADRIESLGVLEINISLVQYINGEETLRKSYIFSKSDSYSVCMKHVLKEVRLLLRPPFHVCLCRYCGRWYTDADIGSTACVPCIRRSKVGHKAQVGMKGSGSPQLPPDITVPPKPKVLHDCSCLICGKEFKSENPKLNKCKACTVPPEERERIRAGKRLKLNAKLSRLKASRGYQRYC